MELFQAKRAFAGCQEGPLEELLAQNELECGDGFGDVERTDIIALKLLRHYIPDTDMGTAALKLAERSATDCPDDSFMDFYNSEALFDVVQLGANTHLFTSALFACKDIGTPVWEMCRWCTCSCSCTTNFSPSVPFEPNRGSVSLSSANICIETDELQQTTNRHNVSGCVVNKKDATLEGDERFTCWSCPSSQMTQRRPASWRRNVPH